MSSATLQSVAGVKANDNDNDREKAWDDGAL